ncbi:MAG: hypothetical protein AABY33_05555 [Pseudomonadota bacterium]
MTANLDAIKASFAKLCSASKIPTAGALSATLSAKDNEGRCKVIITLDTTKLIGRNISDIWISVPTMAMDLKKAGIYNIETDWSHGKLINGKIVPITDPKEIKNNVSLEGNKIYLFPKLTVTMPDSQDSLERVQKANEYATEKGAVANKKSSIRSQSESGRGRG